MKKLIILEFKAKEIENALRMTVNLYRGKGKETAYDRSVARAVLYIQEVLAGEEAPEVDNTTALEVPATPKSPPSYEKPTCPDCGNLGWIYTTEDPITRTTCPCHY